MRVGVLAVQGAFIEHENLLHNMGADSIELREKKDLDQDFSGIVLPGGESTAQGKLLRELGMFDGLRDKIAGGMPVLATCAGLILLAESIVNDSRRYFTALPVTVRRNAYGRQLGSFYAEEEFRGIGRVPMTFIRAPYIEQVSGDTEVLAKVDGKIVAVRYKKQLAMAFHPELNGDERIHRTFLEML